MSELDKRTRRRGKALWAVGALIATAAIVVIVKTRFVSSESSSTLQIRNGEVETAEFTVPIPNGHRPMSRAQMVERAKKHPPAENTVLFLENPGVGGITILRQHVRSKGGEAPAAPTMEGCARSLADVAAHRSDPVVAGAKLVDYSAAGLGRACTFAVAPAPSHMTQVSTSEWTIVCVHPPGEGAACEQVAAGFRRR